MKTAIEIFEGPCGPCRGVGHVHYEGARTPTRCCYCNGTGYEQPYCDVCSAIHHPNNTSYCEEVQFEWIRNEQGLSL